MNQHDSRRGIASAQNACGAQSSALDSLHLNTEHALPSLLAALGNPDRDRINPESVALDLQTTLMQVGSLMALAADFDRMADKESEAHDVERGGIFSRPGIDRPLVLALGAGVLEICAAAVTEIPALAKREGGKHD